MSKKKQPLVETLLNNQNISIPVISIFCGLAGGIILMIATGYNPLDLFAAVLRGTFGINLNSSSKFFNARYIGEFIVYAMPITLTGLSVAFAFRIGLFNIGAEGQLMMGSWAAIATAMSASTLPKIILLPLVVLSGMLAGAIWGGIPGVLKARFNIHEVVVTIMLNYTALYFTNFGYLLLPHTSMVKTDPIPDAAKLHSSLLSSLTNNSRLHWGFIIVILSLFIFWFIIEKTTFGYELRATGYNKHASQFAGIKVNRNITLSMMISGAFAGLAGVLIAVGTFSYGRVLPGFENYGFDGIAVALIGNNTAFGIFFAGLLFSSLKSAQPIMQTRSIPRDIITIIMAIVILMVGMQNGIRILLENIKRKKMQKIAAAPTESITDNNTEEKEEDPNG